MRHHKCALHEELGVPALRNCDGRDKSAPFSPIQDAPRARTLTGFEHLRELQNFLSFDFLIVTQAALLMHGALWPAEGILDVPRPL